MKARWRDAIFNELGRPTPAPALPAPSDEKERPDSGTGWRARRSSIPPKRPGAYDNDTDYALARHARSSLRIDAGRDPVQRMPEARSGRLGPIPFPQAPRYSPERLPGAPNGPRAPLYAQELPQQEQHRSRQSSSTAFIPSVGGFVTPERQYHAYDAGRDTYSLPSSSNRRDPYGHPPPIPPFRPSPSSLQSPSRLHAYSTPSRPAHIPLASAERPHSSPNFPLLPPGRASNAISPCKSPQQSPGLVARAQAKPNQCHGTTGAGKRCTRVVGKAASGKKIPSSSSSPTKPNDRAPPTLLTISALRQLDRRLSVSKHRRRERSGTPIKNGRSRQASNNNDNEDEEDEAYMAKFALSSNREAEDQDEVYEELPVYCFQHAKQTLEQQGTFVGSLFIDFSDWIPHALPQETKLQLRHEISKPISSDDIPGYIYVHEMAGADTNYSPTTFIKLGRSVKPVARLSQWKSQCRSRQPIVRDIFPLHPSHPLHPQATASSLINGSPSRMHGALSFAPQGTRNHHRWERLCLIELAGLAVLQAAERNEAEQARQKCTDCGKIHVELFLVNRGSYERDIRAIVLRWQRFVETIG